MAGSVASEDQHLSKVADPEDILAERFVSEVHSAADSGMLPILCVCFCCVRCALVVYAVVVC
jgi:hypothetical protein